MKANDKLDLNEKVSQHHVLKVKDANGKEICQLWQLPQYPHTLFFQRAREITVYKVGYTIGCEPSRPNEKWFSFMHRDVGELIQQRYIRVPTDKCLPILTEIRDHLEKNGYKVWRDF